MFENERSRVWDLALAPGESLEKHVHRLNFCFIAVQGGALRHIDQDNPAHDQHVQYPDDQVVFIEAGGVDECRSRGYIAPEGDVSRQRG